MGRRKSRIRDYATSAFENYYNCGCPSREVFEEGIRQEVYERLSLKEPKIILMAADSEIAKKAPTIKDIEAVNQMINHLSKTNKDYMIHAVRSIYFVPPDSPSIKNRVLAYASAQYVDVRTVYRWLREARELFALYRGLALD